MADQAEKKSGNRDLAGLRRITWTAIAIALIVFAYFVLADRRTPFAGDGRIQAFVLRVAPEINGQVLKVGVVDNALVGAGDLLFQIDETPFKLALAQAEARLEQAGQSVGASTAAVEAAQAALDEARATDAEVQVQSERILTLVDRGVYAKAREDQVKAELETSAAAVHAAEADLRRAEEELGPQGEDNPAVQDAIAAIERARFDLSRTTVNAPAEGVVTNLQLAAGQTVVTGQPAMTFISGEAVWLLASIRENSLGVIEQGQHAEVVLDGFPGQVFDATVESISWGVAGGSIDPATGLPKSTSATGWLTDPERFAVNLVFDPETRPHGVRYGARAAVIIYSRPNPIFDALAWARIRLIAWLTYVS